ncbi:hypothetical protein [Bradyrhizobium betae]|nr:hypothetical protein [Bradyrhizobium betae]MCS3726420.1 hypothetical protein [Bradyrhizobium betae]
MPMDAVLMSVVVVAIFVAFGAVLAWADRQTSAGRRDQSAKRRSS